MSTNMEKFKAMMKQEDPTSRFVGLFLLLQLLSDSPESAAECWDVVDPAFIDRLVLAKKSKSTTEEEALDLRTMGCSILHAFAGFEVTRSTKKFHKRGDVMMKLYCKSLSANKDIESTRDQVGDVLLCIASDRDGAAQLISNETVCEFAKTVFSNLWPKGYSTVTCMLVNTVMMESITADLFHERLRTILEDLVTSLTRSAASSALGLRVLKEVTSSILPEHLLGHINEKNIDLIREAIKAELVKPVKGIDSSELLVLFASLLRVNGNSFLLQGSAKDEQQFFVLLCLLSSSEIRSSLAVMVNSNTDAKYKITSTKVASCFDIVRLACTYMVTTDELCLGPDDILKVRDAICAAFGETISYFREKWDMSALCPTAAWHNPKVSDATDNSKDSFLLDPTILSGSQALCMWLQEDESVQDDASGIMDVFLSLVKEGRSAGVDYESWVKPAIQALLETDKGRSQFSHFGGSAILKT